MARAVEIIPGLKDKRRQVINLNYFLMSAIVTYPQDTQTLLGKRTIPINVYSTLVRALSLGIMIAVLPNKTPFSKMDYATFLNIT